MSPCKCIVLWAWKRWNKKNQKLLASAITLLHHDCPLCTARPRCRVPGSWLGPALMYAAARRVHCNGQLGSEPWSHTPAVSPVTTSSGLQWSARGYYYSDYSLNPALCHCAGPSVKLLSEMLSLSLCPLNHHHLWLLFRFFRFFVRGDAFSPHFSMHVVLYLLYVSCV